MPVGSPLSIETMIFEFEINIFFGFLFHLVFSDRKNICPTLRKKKKRLSTPFFRKNLEFLEEIKENKKQIINVSDLSNSQV